MEIHCESLHSDEALRFLLKLMFLCSWKSADSLPVRYYRRFYYVEANVRKVL